MTTTLSFASAVNYNVGSNPHSIATGDFNNDGNVDLVTANKANNSVSVLLGNGLGSFNAAINYNVGSAPYCVATGDLNGDGKIDLIVANSNSNSVSVLLGNGTGGFNAAVNYSVGNTPYYVVTGDFNGDGKADLAVANLGSNSVSVLLGNGSGGFNAAVNYGVGNSPFCAATGDFNGDGKIDLVVANAGDDSVSVLLNNGSGGFNAPVNYNVGGSASYIATGDFNKDGKIDLVVANYDSGSVSVLLGDGSGGFNAAVNYNVVSYPRSIAVGDFDGDGNIDLAVTNNGTNNISILLGDGLGGFNAAINYNVGSAPWSIASGDFNNDGNIDLAITDNGSASVSILLNTKISNPTNQYAIKSTAFTLQCNPPYIQYGATAPLTLQTNPPYIQYGATAPLTLQCNPATQMISGSTSFTLQANPSDYVVAVSSASFTLQINPSVAIIMSSVAFNLQCVKLLTPISAASSFSYANYNVGTSPWWIVAGDFNGDGYQDVAVTNLNNNSISVLLQNGSGYLNSSVNYTVGSGPYGIASGDFNGDGKIDLVVANGSSNNISILFNNGSGSFNNIVNYSVGTNPSFVATGDFNNDGYVDIAVTNNSSNNVTILFNDGSGSFSNACTYTTQSTPMGIVTGDFNGDGKIDLAVAAQNNYVTILKNNGSGSFTRTNYAVGSTPNQIVASDFNGDGITDLAITSNYNSILSLLFNTGTGLFASAVNYNVGASISLQGGIVAGDFNNDGVSDLAFANSSGDKICILLNSGTGLFNTSNILNYSSGGGNSSGLVTADFNNDGYIDFAVANNSQNIVSLFLRQFVQYGFSADLQLQSNPSTQIVCNSVSFALPSPPIQQCGATLVLINQLIEKGANVLCGATISINLQLKVWYCTTLQLQSNLDYLHCRQLSLRSILTGYSSTSTNFTLKLNPSDYIVKGKSAWFTLQANPATQQMVFSASFINDLVFPGNYFSYNVSTSTENYLWTGSAEVTETWYNRCQLNKLITLDFEGSEWTMQIVEKQMQQDQNGMPKYSFRLMSPTVQLSDQYATKQDFIFNTDTSAKSIATAIGVNVWPDDVPDWTIPGQRLLRTNDVALSVLRDIVQSGGISLQTDQTGLLTVSTLPGWGWESTDATNVGKTLSLRETVENRKLYSQLIVSGKPIKDKRCQVELDARSDGVNDGQTLFSYGDQINFLAHTPHNTHVASAEASIGDVSIGSSPVTYVHSVAFSVARDRVYFNPDPLDRLYFDLPHEVDSIDSICWNSYNGTDTVTLLPDNCTVMVEGVGEGSGTVYFTNYPTMVSVQVPDLVPWFDANPGNAVFEKIDSILDVTVANDDDSIDADVVSTDPLNSDADVNYEINYLPLSSPATRQVIADNKLMLNNYLVNSELVIPLSGLSTEILPWQVITRYGSSDPMLVKSVSHTWTHTRKTTQIQAIRRA